VYRSGTDFLEAPSREALFQQISDEAGADFLQQFECYGNLCDGTRFSSSRSVSRSSSNNSVWPPELEDNFLSLIGRSEPRLDKSRKCARSGTFSARTPRARSRTTTTRSATSSVGWAGAT